MRARRCGRVKGHAVLPVPVTHRTGGSIYKRTLARYWFSPRVTGCPCPVSIPRPPVVLVPPPPKCPVNRAYSDLSLSFPSQRYPSERASFQAPLDSPDLDLPR